MCSANAQGATRLSEMQAYELWKLEQDAKLIIEEMDKVESESSKTADDNWKLLVALLTHLFFYEMT